MLRNYKDLNVWKKAYKLCLDVYGITKRFPSEERYGLSSQLRRAAVSVPSNIAEGYGRKSTPKYIRFLSIAYGSLCEMETQVLLAGDLNYMNPDERETILKSICEIERMLKALMNSLTSLKDHELSSKPLDP